MKEQPSERGTVFTRYTSDKELVSSIYKEHTHTQKWILRKEIT